VKWSLESSASHCWLQNLLSEHVLQQLLLLLRGQVREGQLLQVLLLLLSQEGQLLLLQCIRTQWHVTLLGLGLGQLLATCSNSAICFHTNTNI
jgi:hypothetical protein